jgi:biotin operon repressor
MTRKKDAVYGIKRLESKNARSAIIQKISADFNLMPIMAEAYYKQIAGYFQEHADIQLSSGQICYEAVAAEEPAGKHIALAKKVSCRLTLNDVGDDFEVLADYGLPGLRRHRILRLTKEAYDQEALLSYEDLAILLTTSPASVKRDIRFLKHDGYFVMTRGAKHDMGPGLSHKTQILELYFKDYTFTEIEQKTNHSERSVWRYLRDFTQVATLHHQDFPRGQIRLITRFSDRLIREYLSLYDEYEHTDRMTQLLHPEPMDEKKGDLQ